MKKIRVVRCGVVLLVLLVMNTRGWALRLDGQTALYGEVLASACTIALSDRFQTVPMGDLTLRDFHRGAERPSRELVIHLDNCLTAGKGPMIRQVDPPVRIRFDGVRGNEPWLFRTQGDAQGVGLMLRDARQDVVYPGEYLPAWYQKAYSQQVLTYRIELVPNGKQVTAGDYSATLRFSIDYE
ncbi:type 1 fimbrial protein [Salmonella enterica subsp. enterica serovar Muenchen]|nr:type 1 fimbrial protein [Salmonella enterica subsp. enterica serovar Muenchen]EDQ9741376.1 type 1 fimbrial protein [Salmonella enterica subsp. enterica serovar Oranienburg]EEO7308624.1 type 1 fimbrial protein [Salmonella enterica]ECZ5457902.1 type 1 fimbrial protein [Salmonella enterica subsp. enterica serovar Muenchen]EEN7399057.1 type 1 fimbrial protein [Salmonella enterica subsp. enterica serovar Muenchen]